MQSLAYSNRSRKACARESQVLGLVGFLRPREQYPGLDQQGLRHTFSRTPQEPECFVEISLSLESPIVLG